MIRSKPGALGDLGPLNSCPFRPFGNPTLNTGNNVASSQTFSITAFGISVICVKDRG